MKIVIFQKFYIRLGMYRQRKKAGCIYGNITTVRGNYLPGKWNVSSVSREYVIGLSRWGSVFTIKFNLRHFYSK
jgi:hypothetical protein